MALAGGEIRERHPVSAADLPIQLMHLAREAIRWKPFAHGVCIEERAVDALRFCPQHAVKSNRICLVVRHRSARLLPSGRALSNLKAHEAPDRDLVAQLLGD